MWPYLYESRSKDYYDDDDSGGSEPSLDWKFFLWLPVIVLFMFFIEILPILAMALYFFKDVYSTLKRTVKSGNFSYPFLVKVGGAVAVILAVTYLAHPHGAPIQPSVFLVLAVGFVFVFTILPVLALCLHRISSIHSFLEARIGPFISYGLYIFFAGILLLTIIFSNFTKQPSQTQPSPANTSEPADNSAPLELSPSATAASVYIPNRSVDILLDDFRQQPYQGETFYFYNRVGGDRGALNNSIVDWGDGQVTTTISTGNTWGGLWMSLNHPIREGLAVNFSAVLPQQILPMYQAQVIGIKIQIAGGTPNKTFRIELKDGNTWSWEKEITLSGRRQGVNVDLPPLQNVSQLVLVLDHANPGDYVSIESISLTASTPIADTATAAFVWSYGMLLNNWNPSTGLVRDKAKDVSGEFDAIQATGSLAAATAIAEQLGIIQYSDAVAIVNKISDTLLHRLPRNHGLWPHWVKVSSAGKIDIVPATEWSSVDSVIAALALLDAQSYLGLDTTDAEQMLRSIEWESLVTESGISHGFTYSNELIPYAWDVFGGESWLVELAYASATGNAATLAYPSPPTANGSGFIDEMAWLYVLPPSGPDYWGTDWASYRVESAEKQISYYATNSASPCFAQHDLFGLSAAEAPVPARVPKENIYQAFGLGGQFAPVNDGADLLGSAVVSPHYSAMTASLNPQAAINMWSWLITNGYFSPLNNVESLTFPSASNCNSTNAEWNQLKGSWNLVLQTLGWGRYLAERNGQVPALWQATEANPFLWRGYLILAPNEQNVILPVTQQDQKLSAILEKSNVTCTGDAIYTRSLPGIYQYKTIDAYGNVDYYSAEQISRSQSSTDYSAVAWPPMDSSISPSISTMTASEVENITTKFGEFQALRVDTTREYRVLTMNHSDPSGAVETNEWYVCGVGLIRGKVNHTGTYQLRNFERQFVIELFSYTPLP